MYLKAKNPYTQHECLALNMYLSSYIHLELIVKIVYNL